MRTSIAMAASLGLATAQPIAAQSFSYAELGPDQVVTAAVEGSDTPGSLYEAGSIGKFACTLAALRLSDADRLDIDASLGSLLPETASTPVAGVTLRQVLQSRSGLADGLMPAFKKDAREVLQTSNAQDALSKYAVGDLANPPGSKWSYDLVNWIVVQAVLEEVTGEPIAAVLRNEVLVPAKMTQSRIFVGAIGEGAQPPAQTGLPIPGFLTCAGGLATTPTDLIALARFAHRGGLSEQSLEALQTVTTPGESYTLGGRFVQRGEEDPRKLSWQSGSNGAYKSLVTYDPVTDTGFAAMTATGSNEAIQEARSQWLKGLDEGD
jgi:CubicO group peptidase (beta-lactamase class C family)